MAFVFGTKKQRIVQKCRIRFMFQVETLLQNSVQKTMLALISISHNHITENNKPGCEEDHGEEQFENSIRKEVSKSEKGCLVIACFSVIFKPERDRKYKR